MGIFQRVLQPVLDECGCLRPKRLLFGLHAPKDVQHIWGDVVRVGLYIGEPGDDTVVFARGTPFRLPQSGDIRFAVQAWCGSRQVRLAVFRAGDPRVGIVQPLRLSVRECPGKHNSDDRANHSLIAHRRLSYLVPLGEAMMKN